jgi:hypothetical protein
MPHDTTSFIEAQAAAEGALLSMVMRSMLARASDFQPSVVALRVEAEDSEDGFSVSVELIDEAGQAVAGWGL